MTGDTIDQTHQSERLEQLLELLQDLMLTPSAEPCVLTQRGRYGPITSHREFRLPNLRISVSASAGAFGKRSYTLSTLPIKVLEAEALGDATFGVV